MPNHEEVMGKMLMENEALKSKVSELSLALEKSKEMEEQAVFLGLIAFNDYQSLAKDIFNDEILTPALRNAIEHRLMSHLEYRNHLAAKSSMQKMQSMLAANPPLYMMCPRISYE